MRVTHYGTATVLIETDGLRLLTDPVFDPSATKHRFAGSSRGYVAGDTTPADVARVLAAGLADRLTWREPGVPLEI